MSGSPAQSLWMVVASFCFAFHPIDFDGAIGLLGVGGFATVAQLAMTRSIRLGNAMASAGLSYSAVVFASLFGVYLCNESLAVDAWLAIALILP